MATAIVNHPSASFIEPSNEPMSLNRRGMYDTWRAVTEEVTKIIPGKYIQSDAVSKCSCNYR